MSIEIRLYVEKKKVNSTKLPTGVGGQLILNCNIKAPSSVIHPTIEIATTANILKYNYAYIPQFSRYYWINDMTFDRGLWVLDLSVDVLATYKSDIGNYNGYVLRSSAQSDGSIMDNLYPTNADTTVQVVTADPGVTFNGFENGNFVVGIQGKDNASDAGVIYFLLTPARFRTLLNNFYANSQGSFWGNISSGIINSLNKISDYIVSCYWYPNTITFTTVPDQDIFVGSLFNPNLKGDKITSYSTTLTSSWQDVPKHPQAATRGNYLNIAPYSVYHFHSDLIGDITMQSEQMKDCLRFRSVLNVDVTTGQARFAITGSFNPLNTLTRRIYSTYVDLGVQIPLDGTNISVIAAGSNALQTGAALLSGDFVGAAAGIGNTLNSLLPTPGSKGPNGGIVGMLGHGLDLICYFHEVIDDNNNDYGRPLCQVIMLSNLGGYMELDNPHVQVIGTSQEADMVNNYLSSGIYYE